MALTYEPEVIVRPKNLIQVKSAWVGLESILADIINKFGVRQNSCIEFGVEFGYSTAALSNYFQQVIGVDTFEGDVHSGANRDFFHETQENLNGFTNIILVKSDYKSFIENHTARYSMAHVDIVHTFDDTYLCGEWCIKNAGVVLFHDTVAFSSVMDAVTELANVYGKTFYNYPFCNGLGILI